MEIKYLSSSFFENNNNNNNLKVPIFDFDNLDSCVKYNNNSEDKDRNMSPSFQDQENRNNIVGNS